MNREKHNAAGHPGHAGKPGKPGSRKGGASAPKSRSAAKSDKPGAKFAGSRKSDDRPSADKKRDFRAERSEPRGEKRSAPAAAGQPAAAKGRKFVKSGKAAFRSKLVPHGKPGRNGRTGSKVNAELRELREDKRETKRFSTDKRPGKTQDRRSDSRPNARPDARKSDFRKDDARVEMRGPVRAEAPAGSEPVRAIRPPAGVTKVVVTHEEDGSRVDRWFSRRFPGLTHGMLEKMLRTGQIRVNGKRIRAKDRMMEDDEIRLPPQLVNGTLELAPKKAVAQRMDGSLLQEQVIFMDGNVIVINKPSGLATQGGSGLTKHVDGMLDSLMFEKKTRPKLVHRLDKDTSGVLVIARNASSAAILSKSLAERDANKIYWALTKGVPKPRRGVIKAALVKEGGLGPRGTDERMTVAEEGNKDAKAASTAYVVMGVSGEYAWVACKPLTGRTHQIRVHLASIGTPIVGDFKYGGTNARGHGELIDQLHLHARSIDMAAPDQVRVQAVAELPEHMKKAWEMFGFDPDNQEDPFVRQRRKK